MDFGGRHTVRDFQPVSSPEPTYPCGFGYVIGDPQRLQLLRLCRSHDDFDRIRQASAFVSRARHVGRGGGRGAPAAARSRDPLGASPAQPYRLRR
jgi:hypothetical protein